MQSPGHWSYLGQGQDQANRAVFSSAFHRLTQMSGDTKKKAVLDMIQYTKARGLLGEESGPRIRLLTPMALCDS